MFTPIGGKGTLVADWIGGFRQQRKETRRALGATFDNALDRLEAMSLAMAF